MTSKIIWSDEARKQLRKLDNQVQKELIKYLTEKIASAKHPHDFGKPLRHDKYGLWRYRVGDVCVICQINDKEFLLLVLRVAHRKNVYL